MSLHNWMEFRRQPFMALGQILFKSVVQIVKTFWPFILIMFLNSGGERKTSSESILILLPAFALIKSLVNYFFFRFRVTAEEIQVNTGIFSRKQISLPMAKIQAVQIQQNWLQKLLNLSALTFDSPGTEKIELTIQLNKVDALSLMEYVMQKTKVEASVDNKEEVISKLSTKDLFLIGLSSNHFETLLILIGLFFSFLNNIKDVLVSYNENILEDSTNRIIDSGVLLVAIGLLGLFILSVCVSLIRSSLMYLNFTLLKTRQGFNINKGLITSSQQLIPIKKIQFLSWNTNWLRKIMSMYLFEFHTIGAKQVKNNQKVKVPVTSEMVLHKLIDSYALNIPTEFSNNLKINRSYVIRNTVFVGILPALLFSIPLYVFTQEKAFLIFLLPIYVLLYATLYFIKFQFSWNKDIIRINSGVLGRRTVLLKWEKIQSVKISQSLFQQRKNLANLVINTAGGVLTAPYIPLIAAREVQNYALYKVESSKENWQ